MNKLTLKQKRKYSDSIESFIKEIETEASSNIETEDFGSCVVGGSYHEAIFDLLKDFGVDIKEEDLEENIDDIIECINIDNLYDLKGFVEVETSRDADSEPKYVYENIIFKYTDGKFYRVRVQTSNNKRVGLEFEGEVKKKETITYNWR